MKLNDLIENQDTVAHYLHTTCSSYIQEMRQQIEIADRVLHDERYGESFLQSYVRKSDWLYRNFFSRRSNGNAQSLFSMLAAKFEKTEPSIAKISKNIISPEIEISTTRSKLFDNIGAALLSIVTTMIEKKIYLENKAALENLRNELKNSITKFETLYREFVTRNTKDRPQEIAPVKQVNIVNQQRAQAEVVFNQILSTLSSGIAGDLRNRSKRIDSSMKLKWLMNELSN